MAVRSSRAAALERKMTLLAKNSPNAYIGLFVIWTLFLPAFSYAQTQTFETPNGVKQELKTHTPPAPPPSAKSAPALELFRSTEGKAKPYTGPHIDVLTYHYDNKRSGSNPRELDLTPGTVASSNFSLLQTLSVDGNVFAQPLLVSDFAMPDGREHDVLIIVTGHNTVYAYDAETFVVLWQVNLGQAQQFLDVGCADVQPEYGITSTPVIVRNAKDSATLYLVAAVEPRAMEFHTFVHAIDLKTGKDIVAPKEIAPSATLTDGSQLSFSPQNQWSRAGLAYNDGRLYVSIGSHCDNDRAKISGWLLQYSEKLDLQASFHTISAPKGAGLASIWMTGFAPAIDDQGNIFVVTGNGDFNPPNDRGEDGDYSESVLKLDGKSLKVVDYFTPSNYAMLNQRDGDFGSGGILLFPADSTGSGKNLAAALGKDPVLYLLDQANLGKNQPNNAGALQALQLPPCPQVRCRGLWGGSADFQSKSRRLVFAQIEHDFLRSYQLDSAPTPVLKPTSVQGSTQAGYGGSIPIVSSNQGADGVVWLLRRSAPIELEAYAADALGPPLVSAQVGQWSNPGYGNSFLTPMVANGRVYAPAYKTVKVFGLGAQGMTAATQASQSLR
jgi:outer membrane protein assembly factor BamB